jgi:RNA polymerase sigma-70 factor (ECF subfamily)
MVVATTWGDAVFMSVTPQPRGGAVDIERVDVGADSLEWLEALRDAGRRRDDAIERLHAFLVRTARFEVRRRFGASGDARRQDVDDLAMQAADDALMAILRKLDTFRGDSSFTTWAATFALFEAAVKVRRRAWLRREIPLEADGWARIVDERASSPRDAELSELIGAVGSAIAETLTPHQRAVLIAITLNDVPIDVLAERRSTTRGALYKTLHDARKKLRLQLEADGHTLAAAGV